MENPLGLPQFPQFYDDDELFAIVLGHLNDPAKCLNLGVNMGGVVGTMLNSDDKKRAKKLDF